MSNDVLKIVFFTNKCSHGAALLKEIIENRIRIEAIVIEKSKPHSMIKQAKKIIRRNGYLELSRQALDKLVSKLLVRDKLEEWQKDEFYSAYSTVVCFNSFNDDECENFLRKIEPDLIVLGGSRIIRSHIIAIPKIGILNAHPGLLPKYRGVSVIPWAILNGDEVGVTVHFVDEGVDTGRICLQRTLPLERGDTIDRLRERAEKLAASLVVETLLMIQSKKDHIELLENYIDAGKQYYKMSRKFLKKAEKKLAERLEFEKS